MKKVPSGLPQKLLTQLIVVQSCYAVRRNEEWDAEPKGDILFPTSLKFLKILIVLIQHILSHRTVRI